MAKPSPWPTIHAERGALASDLDGLTDEQWNTKSLVGWTAQQTLGHMTQAAVTNPGKWFIHFAGSGFQFNKMVEKDITAQCEGGPSQTLARFKAIANSNGHPPGPVDSWLGETIVHAEDIRRPLGIAHEYPIDAVTRLIEFFRASNLLIGAKKRAEGLTLKPTDADWSIGTGPEVNGPAIDILMAITGRGAALDNLKGDGADALRARL
jgi:uncharacterized protein (TIGR03083 family)